MKVNVKKNYLMWFKQQEFIDSTFFFPFSLVSVSKQKEFRGQVLLLLAVVSPDDKLCDSEREEQTDRCPEMEKIQ